MCSHENLLIEARVCIQLVTQFPVVLDRHVSTQCVDYQTCSCACSHTETGVCTIFLTYEVMSMRNFKHHTLFVTKFSTGALETKYHITTFKLMNPSHYATFDLQGRLRVQIVT